MAAAPAAITQDERRVVEASGSDSGENLSRKERIAPAGVAQDWPPKAKRVRSVVGVNSRGETVNFSYIQSDEPKPVWFMSVLQGFASVATLRDGWDGSGAARIKSATINRALRTIEQLLPSDAPPPSIVPVPDSGLQLEWHRNQRDLEIEFSPRGEIEFYYFDENTGEEIERSVNGNFADLKKYLDRIWQ